VQRTKRRSDDRDGDVTVDILQVDLYAPAPVTHIMRACPPIGKAIDAL
jgi:predicted transcriptional regulator